MSNPLISIIIPTKNSATTLERCLDSIINQTFKDFEIIVVDNFSKDDTKIIAQKYTKSFFQCGPERSTQVNYGVTKANGEYVYRVDSDFVLEQGVLEEAVKKCQEGYDAVLIHNSSDPTVSFWSKIRNFERDMYVNDDLNVAARFIRKSVFESINGFNENLIACEDYDLHNKLVRANYKIAKITSKEIHLGEPKSIIDIAKKHYYYGKTLHEFIKVNPTLGIKQLSPIRPSYFRNWQKFLRHPVLTVGFFIYQGVRYTSAMLGYSIKFLNNKI